MMGWNRLKLVLVSVLVCANLVLGICTAVLVRDSGYISDDALKRMETMLAEDAITLRDGAIDTRKPNLVICEGMAGDAYYGDIAAALSGSSTEHSFLTPNGYVLAMENGDRFAFRDGFGIQYEKKNTPEVYTAASIKMEALTALSGKDARLTVRAVDSFLQRARRMLTDTQALYPLYTVSYIGEDPAGGIRYVIAVQNIRGSDIASFRAVFAVMENTVIGMSGEWCMAEMEASFSAQLIDQINILYSVRQMILESRAEGQAEPLCRIDSLCLAYAPYFRSDTDHFYMIPAWRVEMNDGKIYMINAVDGSLYTN